MQELGSVLGEHHTSPALEIFGVVVLVAARQAVVHSHHLPEHKLQDCRLAVMVVEAWAVSHMANLQHGCRDEGYHTKDWEGFVHRYSLRIVVDMDFLDLAGLDFAGLPLRRLRQQQRMMSGRVLMVFGSEAMFALEQTLSLQLPWPPWMKLMCRRKIEF